MLARSHIDGITRSGRFVHVWEVGDSDDRTGIHCQKLLMDYSKWWLCEAVDLALPKAGTLPKYLELF